MTPAARFGSGVSIVGVARPKDDEVTRKALQRALDLARESLSIIDEVSPGSVAAARGQHFMDAIERLLQS